MIHRQLVLLFLVGSVIYVASASPVKEKPESEDEAGFDNELPRFYNYRLGDKEITIPAQVADAIRKRAQQTQPSKEVDTNKYKDIAFNSREVKLVGPERRETELKDDVATKMVLALENLQKEASDVWGQVNVKLDQGWSDFKTMIDKAVESAKESPPGKQLIEALSPSSQPGKTVVVSDKDTYVIPGETGETGEKKITKQISDLVDSAGSKVGGLLKDIGIIHN